MSEKNVLLSLPSDLIHLVFTMLDSDVKDIARLDSAVCSRTYRPMFIEAVSRLNLSLPSRIYSSLDVNVIKWIYSRHFKVKKIEFSSSCLSAKVAAVLPYFRGILNERSHVRMSFCDNYKVGVILDNLPYINNIEGCMMQYDNSVVIKLNSFLNENKKCIDVLAFQVETLYPFLQNSSLALSISGLLFFDGNPTDPNYIPNSQFEASAFLDSTTQFDGVWNLAWASVFCPTWLPDLFRRCPNTTRLVAAGSNCIHLVGQVAEFMKLGTLWLTRSTSQARQSVDFRALVLPASSYCSFRDSLITLHLNGLRSDPSDSFRAVVEFQNLRNIYIEECAIAEVDLMFVLRRFSGIDSLDILSTGDLSARFYAMLFGELEFGSLKVQNCGIAATLPEMTTAFPIITSHITMHTAQPLRHRSLEISIFLPAADKHGYMTRSICEMLGYSESRYHNVRKLSLDLAFLQPAYALLIQVGCPLLEELTLSQKSSADFGSYSEIRINCFPQRWLRLRSLSICHRMVSLAGVEAMASCSDKLRHLKVESKYYHQKEDPTGFAAKNEVLKNRYPQLTIMWS